ncbi:hypothetical protein LEMLEM_LOCUS18636 [Lemmus lemmus]
MLPRLYPAVSISRHVLLFLPSARADEGSSPAICRAALLTGPEDIRRIRRWSALYLTPRVLGKKQIDV